MMELFSWLAANWQVIAGTAAGVVTGASIVVKAIAPHTANTADDAAAKWLDKVHKYLSKIALNPPLK